MTMPRGALLLQVSSFPELRPMLQSAKEAEGGWHPVMRDLGVTMYRGVRCWALVKDGVCLHVNATHFGKRKKNKWEPYANWYIAYTHPEHRRRGIARDVALRVRQLAVEAGCCRMKSLAGSYAGLRLHMSLGDECWGISPNNEVAVDTPLVEGDWSGTPPNAVTPHPTPLPVLESITALRYD